MVRDPKSEVDMGIQCLIIIYILITHILYKVVINKYGFKTYKGYHFEYINNYEREEDIEKID